ncbi:MAG: spore cortex biosynthesis protein YabQ [Clostridium sp.]
MVLTIGVQLTYFFSTIVAGLIAGALFDVYRVVVGGYNKNKIMEGIADILFWIFEALAIFVYLIATNDGDIRYYTFIGIALGAIIYFAIISKVFRIVLTRTLQITYKLFSIICNIVYLPIKMISHGFSILRLNICEKAYEINKKIEIKKSLKPEKPKKEGKKTFWKNMNKSNKKMKVKKNKQDSA